MILFCSHHFFRHNVFFHNVRLLAAALYQRFVAGQATRRLFHQGNDRAFGLQPISLVDNKFFGWHVSVPVDDRPFTSVARSYASSVP